MSGSRVCVPDGSHMLCHHCLNHGVSEENEISRHYKKEHPDHPEWFSGQGKTPYDLCRIVPDDVAGFLGVSFLQRRPPNPVAPKGTYKSRPATVQEMHEMFRQRQRVAPAVLTPVNIAAALILPPSPAPAAPAVPVLPTPAIAAVPVANNNHDDDSNNNNTAITVAATATTVAANNNDDAMDINDEDAPINQHANRINVEYGPPPRPIAGGAIEVPLDVLETPDVYHFDDTSYTCHLCVRGTGVSGTLPEMVDHYDYKHQDLQYALGKVYTGRWIKRIFEDAHDATEITDYVSFRNIGRRLHNGKVTRADMHDFKCYVCMHKDQASPGWTFVGLDAHFASENVKERWEVMREVMREWTKKAEAADAARNVAGESGRDATMGEE